MMMVTMTVLMVVMLIMMVMTVGDSLARGGVHIPSTLLRAKPPFLHSAWQILFLYKASALIIITMKM